MDEKTERRLDIMTIVICTIAIILLQQMRAN